MKTTRSVAVFGSTGSIGEQTLQVAAHLGLRVDALAARHNIEQMERQVRKFRPRFAALSEPDAAKELAIRLADLPTKVLPGAENIEEIAALSDADTAVIAMEGISGLIPTIACIRAGKKIALANKETLVCAGRIVFSEARTNGVDIVPIDSEHAAIRQCLESRGNGADAVHKILLTASGGPFYGMDAKKLSAVTPEDALRHPNWNMGKKITVDSASMMNKGLELIEAMHLFDLPPERIDVVIHKESIVHSMVEFIDHSVVAQLGIADMRLPIQYALTWPARTESLTPSADLCRIGCLHFALPDEENFRCLPLARRVASMPSSAAAAMNGANEAAVAAFLNGKLSFPGIAEVCEHVVSNTDIHECSDIRDVLETDREARAKASEYVAGR